MDMKVTRLITESDYAIKAIIYIGIDHHNHQPFVVFASNSAAIYQYDGERIKLSARVADPSSNPLHSKLSAVDVNTIIGAAKYGIDKRHLYRMTKEISTYLARHFVVFFQVRVCDPPVVLPFLYTEAGTDGEVWNV